MIVERRSSSKERQEDHSQGDQGRNLKIRRSKSKENFCRHGKKYRAHDRQKSGDQEEENVTSPMATISARYHREKSSSQLLQIRQNLHQLGVRTNTAHARASQRIGVFDDSCWERYGKSGDVLIFDLETGSVETDAPSRHRDAARKLLCEDMEMSRYPWRGRGRYNAEWSIKPRKDEPRTPQIGDFSGGLFCRRLQSSKVTATHGDKHEAFKVYERTTNREIQEHIMRLGDTPETDNSLWQKCTKPVPMGKDGTPDFYRGIEEDEIREYQPTYHHSQGEKPTEKTHLTENEDADGVACWPCVLCDEDSPKSQWCSLL